MLFLVSLSRVKRISVWCQSLSLATISRRCMSWMSRFRKMLKRCAIRSYCLLMTAWCSPNSSGVAQRFAHLYQGSCGFGLHAHPRVRSRNDRSSRYTDQVKMSGLRESEVWKDERMASDRRSCTVYSSMIDLSVRYIMACYRLCMVYLGAATSYFKR